jgi:YVTN family beta-propeller protein
MRKNIIMLIVLFTAAVYFSGCSKDNPVITPVQLPSTKGAYILSEGSLTPGASALSFYSSVKDSFYLSIFSNGNLGLFPDGIQLYSNNLYITEQGNFGQPGKLHKLDTTGSQITENVSVGTNPYSLTIANNKIYVTNGPASNVSVLDINSLSLIKTISVGVYPQEILAIGSKVFVGNKSAFGGTQDSTVSVIDVTHDSVVTTIVVRQDPSSLALTNDGKLLVGCPGSANIIYKIDPSTYVKTDSMAAPEGFTSDISVDLNSTNIYFIGGMNSSGDRVTKLDLSTKTFSTIINANAGSTFYGYGFDSDNKKHYVLDAKNFNVNGSLYIYNINNSLKNTFTTGIAPRRVVFKRD